MSPRIKHGGQIRSNEQLLLLLKLVEANGLESKRRNVKVRQKIWDSIADRLNCKNGAIKDAEGWKRCYISWRVTTGKNYKEEMRQLLQKIPNESSHFIEVSDEEPEIDNEQILDFSDPSETQKQRLHELVLKNKELLLSKADDKTLKIKLWENITEELNRIPGALSLTPNEWEKQVDWDKYKTKKGRKPMQRNESTEFENSANTIDNNKTQEYSSIQSINMLSNYDETTQNSASCESFERHNTLTQMPSIDEMDMILEEAEQDINDEYLFEFSDQDDYEPNLKRIKPTPLANSFKSTVRIANAVECLKDDVRNMGNSLKQTTENLDSLKTLLERQCQQQEEFNTLLKRNTQLLKVLVEFKIGKRTSISTKKNGLPTFNGSENI